MERKIKIFQNDDDLSHFFAEQLADQIRKIPEGKYFSLALSGGSTPKSVFQFLAKNFKDSIAWEKIRVFWGDERCVPPENELSNYRMTKESLLDLLPIPAGNIFRIKGELEPKTEAARYAKVVKRYIPIIDNLPQFDMIMLGLGEDGHTASIFPENLHLFDSDKLFEVALHPQTNQKRITATGKMINRAKTIFFLVTGESKATMLARIINKSEGWEKLPASRVQPLNGKLFWLLDHNAGLKLNSTDKR